MKNNLWVAWRNDRLSLCARAAGEQLFAERETHAFPPDTIIPHEWNVELETLALSWGYSTTKTAEIQEEFTNLVATIASA
jgi:hypothetical protein